MDTARRRWTRVEEIFDAAVDLDGGARAVYLDQACGADLELRKEIEELLAADAAAPEFLEGQAAEFAAPLLAEVDADPGAPGDLDGAMLGAYRLLRVIGRGGMGSVYLAERADGAFRQQVAAKVLRRGLDTDDLVQRFRNERQILASLDHPNIARLLDGGATPDGRPYLVMELVEGEPINRFCDRRQLLIRDRLKLLLEVCRTMEYAHRSRVVHRDLKPSNILVTETGRVKVLDFGIAKLLDDSGKGPRTRTGARLLTPEYASPEQVCGGQLTAASDVYQLGMLLYKLLTGGLPYQINGRSPGELEEAVCRVDPAPPSACVQQSAKKGEAEDLARSRGTNSEQLVKLLRGALDAITLRSLCKEPERRYSSAGEMAEDIERYLSAQPVRARCDAWHGRARRFFAGRRAAVVGASASLLVLAAVLLPRAPWLDAASPLDAQSVAILPFRTGGADPSLAYLREGMVDLLATKLTGESGDRAVDPRNVMSAWRRMAGDDRDLPRDSALLLAKDLQAGRVLLGEVVGTPAHLVMTASVLSVPGGETRARATVEGPADSLPAMVDRLTAQVLSREAGEAEHRLAALTSTSLPALRAYLRGTAAFRRARHEDAIQEFNRALDLDSTFALAGIGLQEASGWAAGAGDNGRGLRLAWKSRERLSPFDRTYLLALAGPRYPAPSSTAEILEQWRRAVEMAPDRFEGWYRLGDEFFHHGASLGVRDWRTRAIAYQKRAVALDSTSAPLVSHLLHLALAARDTAAARPLAELYFAGNTEEEGQYLRWFSAQVRGDSAELRQIRSRLDELSDPTLIWLEGTAVFDGIGLDDGDRAIAILKRRTPAPGFEETLFREVFYTELNRGRPGAAAQTAERLRGIGEVPRVGLRLQVLAALYGDANRRVAEAAARTLARHADAPPARSPAEREAQDRDLCVLEQWRLWQGNTGSAAGSIQRLRRSGANHSLPGSGMVERNANCALLLDAIHATVQQRSDAARLAARADSMMRTGPVMGSEIKHTANLALARVHEAQGNPAAALAAARRRGYLEVNSSFLLASYLQEEGRLAVLVGDRAGAMRAYRHYLALRSDSEPGLRGEAERVRAELKRLAR